MQHGPLSDTALRPQPKPPGLTLVFNPNARKPRLRPPCRDELQRQIGPRSRIHITQNLEELDRLMRAWSEEDETLCFYGGDGSIARGLTSLIRHHGEGCELPPVLAVRAGTINMLCTIVGFREKVEKTLGRWNRGELRVIKTIPTLKVEAEGRPPQYGFVFAAGIGFRFLRHYYARSPVPDVTDAVAVFIRIFLSAMLPAANSTPMFFAEDMKVSLNGKPAGCGPLRALTVGTIPRVSLGIRPFAPEPIVPGGFHVSGNGMPIHKVVWHSPTVLFGWGDQRKLHCGSQLLTATQAKCLEFTLRDGFTMDGEMFELGGISRIRITPGPAVRFWTSLT